ncbi:5'-AMP-activated protein kinase catalytic subunit alpha-2 [Trichinella pseudospiralis]|uniref:non-specific serine/threonine protein kinase n=1 Tax=Trichinella pseudospiralis TaxID=6337 RepID=A0A0V0XVB5_TRIPS|nr:5'-AMP-activated protein kinase catalytic subunit alpha-2 [Trichinella pseudospiralis]
MADNIPEVTEPMKINHWQLGKTIGSGSFGKVKLAVHQVNGIKAAIKIISREKIRQRKIADKTRREIENLRLFRHPHIVQLISYISYEVVALPSDIFMVMEYMSGGDLGEYIHKNGKLQEHEARRIFQQLISAVDYCHRHKVVHRDLKLENLLLDSENNIKLTDFGLSNFIKDGKLLKTSCGSLNYAAPELLHGHYYAGPEVDIWSCGIVLYVLLSGYLPFEDDREMVLYQKIKSGVYAIPNCFSKSVTSLIYKILQVHPMRRATAKTIMAHPWFAVDVPDYLFPKISDEETSIVDLSVVKEISEKFHVREKDVIMTLAQNDPYNQFSIAYNLAVEKKRSGKNEIANLYSENFHLMNMSDISKEHPPTSKCNNNSTSAKPTSNEIKTTVYKSTHVNEERWHLGVRSSEPPEVIMIQLFHTMKSLNFEWRIINPFHVIVRRKGDLQSPKMILQLYTIERNNYLLDFTSSVETTADTPSDLLNESNGIAADLNPNSSTALNRPSTSAAMHQGPTSTAGSNTDAAPPSSQIMQFFEMCASIISAMSK